MEEMKRLQGLRAETLKEPCQTPESRDGAIRCPIPCKSSRYGPALWSDPSGSCGTCDRKSWVSTFWCLIMSWFFFHDSGGIGIVSWELHKIFLISFWARFVTLQFFLSTTIWCLFKCPSTFLFILSSLASFPFLFLYRFWVGFGVNF